MPEVLENSLGIPELKIGDPATKSGSCEKEEDYYSVPLTSIFTTAAMLASSIAAAVFSIRFLAQSVPVAAAHDNLLWLAGIFIYLSFTIVEYRIFLHFFPLQTGVIQKGSRAEYSYCVYMLHLIFVY